MKKEVLMGITPYVLDELSDVAHDNAVKHGFYDEYSDMSDIYDALTRLDKPDLMKSVTRDMTLAQLAKIAGEVGEAVEAIQKDKVPDDFAEELADIIIRTIDLAAFACLSIGEAVAKKMAFNESRPYKHGKTC